MAQELDELSLRKGNIITNVIQKLDGWWEGELESKRGLFPDNFVKVIPSSESQSSQEDEVFTETVQLRKKPCNQYFRFGGPPQPTLMQLQQQQQQQELITKLVLSVPVFEAE
ncbi:unnamed protein product [Allacma fusca]|uniref:SH3 domain-containing protein n=1 Tax=Allacma fusca TaxID=39272 RepID=A0A8J2KXV4_9HEXA|nr:unnamed protein product [Allacma fusca]